MKKVIINSLLLAIAAMFVSCDKPINGFDNDTNYVYIDRPYVLDIYNRPTAVRVDSIFYSFALDANTVTSHTFEVPVKIAGLKSDKDRSYSVEVVPDKTTALDAEWDKSAITGLTIKSGELGDVIKLTVNRTASTKTEWRHITLRVVANDEFEMGAADLQTIKISYSDLLTPPDWWTKWLGVFGEFSREKFLKWQEIYYFGADPNAEAVGPGMGQMLYWNNMPFYANSSWYPSTYLFIRILKQYYIDNEVYPDGDTTKARISLP